MWLTHEVTYCQVIVLVMRYFHEMQSQNEGTWFLVLSYISCLLWYMTVGDVEAQRQPSTSTSTPPLSLSSELVWKILCCHQSLWRGGWIVHECMILYSGIVHYLLYGTWDHPGLSIQSYGHGTERNWRELSGLLEFPGYPFRYSITQGPGWLLYLYNLTY